MTVKELIIKLLDINHLNNEVRIHVDVKPNQAHISGILFDINEVKWDGLAEICIEDWRKDEYIPVDWIEDYSKCQNIQENEEMIKYWRSDERDNFTTD